MSKNRTLAADDDDPWTEIVKMTQPMAEKLLATQVGDIINRPQSSSFIMQCRDVMLEGGWKINGQRILVDRDGNLLNGQHRLQAFLEACAVRPGFTLRMEIGHGYDRDVFDTIDCGRSRNAGDILGIRGYTNTKKLAATAALILAWRSVESGSKRRDMTTSGIPRAHILAFVDANPSIHVSVSCTAPVPKGFPCACLAALHFLSSEIDPAKADSFIQDVRLGANLRETDPALLFRNRIIARRASSQSERRDFLQVGLRAFEAYRTGQAMFRLQSPRGDAPPDVRPRRAGK